MKELEVSKRTILRDIEELKSFYHSPIEYDRIKKGYYYTDQTFFVKNVLLTESEIVALASILPLLERYNNTPLKETLIKVYNTISEMLPDQVQVQSSLLTNVQFISDPLPDIDAEVFHMLLQAINTHRTLSFDYRSIKATEYTPHKLDPYKLYSQKGDWYVVGFCHKHRTYTTYSLSRMKVPVLGETFTPDSDYEKKVRIDPNFGIWSNDTPVQKIELLFNKSVNTYILERTWHKNQICRQQEDGTVYLSFESNQIQEALHWILSFGSAVKILNPPSLQEIYRQEVQKMYQG